MDCGGGWSRLRLRHHQRVAGHRAVQTHTRDVVRLNLEPDAGAWAVGVLQPVDADPGAGGSCQLVREPSRAVRLLRLPYSSEAAPQTGIV